LTKKLRELDQLAKLKKLQSAIAYQFKDEKLLCHALTHKSYSSHHNERMEFLGDAILNTSITIYLYKNFSKQDEGELSRIRASLVKGETLAKIAKELNFGDYLFLGAGELKSGGYKRASILANVVEAVIGAVFLEGGFAQAEQFVLSLYQGRLDEDTILSLDKDPKSRLQEYLQSRKMELPIYEVVNVQGKDHDQMFTVSCQISAMDIEVEVQGRNRRSAERKVAELVLKKLNN
jgi:ribonuclease-3